MAPRIAFDAPVTEVTLLEDRAHVLRRGTVTLAAGRSTLIIEGVAPVLADKTLAAAFLGGADHATIDDLRMRRRWVPRAERSGDRHTLQERLRTLSQQRNQLAEDYSRAAHRLHQHQQLIQLATAEMAEDVPWDRAPQSEWRAQYDAMQREAQTGAEALLAQQFQLEDLDEQIRLVHVELAEAQGGNPTRGATVEIDVTPPAAGSYELRVEYVVPGACWRPYHVARLTEPGGDAPASIHWESQGCAWQHTGEDWTDVQLRFSTQRLSLGAEPPRLGTDTLAVKKKADTLEVEAREEAIQTTGLGRAQAVAAEVPGVDDGGQTLTLTALARATVPSDGRPYRVPLFAFTAESTTELLATPELALAALWKSEQANGAAHAILAGPVDLVRRYGLVGRTTVLYVAAGAKFELGWGPDPEIRMRREHHQINHDRGMLSSWDGREQRIAVRLSNLAPSAKTLTLKERVPVSEVEKVKVEPDAAHTTDGTMPDADGFVSWSVTLEPFGTTHVQLRYTLKVHKDVVGL